MCKIFISTPKKGRGGRAVPPPPPHNSFLGGTDSSAGPGGGAGGFLFPLPSPPPPRGRFFWHRKINGSALGPAIPGMGGEERGHRFSGSPGRGCGGHSQGGALC